MFKLLLANTAAQEKTAETNSLIAEETKLARQEASLGRRAQEKGFREAKRRNGHASDQTIFVGELAKKGIELQERTLARLEQSATLLVKDTKDAAAAVEEKRVIAAEDRDVLVGHGDQVVQEQHVEHQVVGTTEKK